MALFPQGLTNVDQRCNRGERRVLHQLKRCLGDDHLVWHNVPIGRGLLRLARGRRGAGFPRAVPRAPVPVARRPGGVGGSRRFRRAAARHVHGQLSPHPEPAAARPHPLAPVPGAGDVEPGGAGSFGRRAAVAAGPAARADRPVLVPCFNLALADRIAAQLRERGVDERVQVRTFHGWCKDVVDSYQLDVPWVPDKPAQLQQMVHIEAGFERALHPARPGSARRRCCGR